MANKTPFFISGANCKIRVGGVTLAFATDLSYEVSIIHIPAKILGMYEASTQEPVAYNIAGSFTVIKYIEGLKERLEQRGVTAPHGVSNTGNGVGAMVPGHDTLGRLLTRLHESLDPSKLEFATGFDIEIYQKVPAQTDTSRTAQIAGDVLTGRLQGSIVDMQQVTGDVSGIARIRDCHITGMKASLTRRGLMTQSYSFVANYLDEDTFLSSASGLGQDNL
jgi:hypothetical protein